MENCPEPTAVPPAMRSHQVQIVTCQINQIKKKKQTDFFKKGKLVS